MTGTPQRLKEFQINFSDLVLKDCIKLFVSIVNKITKKDFFQRCPLLGCLCLRWPNTTSILFFRRLFTLELASGIETSDFIEYTNAVDAIKILIEEKWIVKPATKSRLLSGQIHHCRFAHQRQNRIQIRDEKVLFDQLGQYYVLQLNMEQTEQFDFIHIHIENMLLATSLSPLSQAQYICDTLLPYFEKFGPIARGVTMMKLLANRRDREDKT